MRILHVIPGLTLERGGPTTVLHALARHQAIEGHEVTVLATDQGARHGERLMPMPPDVSFEQANVRGPDRLAYAPGIRKLLRRLLAENDLVHVHSIFTHTVHATLQEALAAGTRVVVRPCGMLHRFSLRRTAWPKRMYLKIWGKMLRRACSAWHYTSAAEAAESWPFDESPRFILPNGIEPDEFPFCRDDAERHVAATWPAIGRAPYVLFLGRLHPKKRLDLLLEAAAAGLPPEWKLVAAGPDEQRMWEGVTRHCPPGFLKEKVIRLDAVGGRDKAALLAAARLFALPSEHENFGVAPLEALAAGTPVLLSPEVDLAQENLPDGSGWKAPLNAEAWSQALERLTADPAALKQGGELGKRWARQNFTWSRISGRLLERYHDLCQAGTRKSRAAASTVQPLPQRGES